jgi:hypothetical protein
MKTFRANKTIIFIVTVLFSSALITSGLFQSGFAWTQGDSDTDPLIVKTGSGEPILDGIKEDIWTSANDSTTLINGFTTDYYALLSGDYLYILIELKLLNPDDDQFVRIYLSNSTSSGNSDFLDVKMIQNENFTQSNRNFSLYDQSYIFQTGYSIDEELDFEGASNFTGSSSIYEFKIPVMNNESDTYLQLFNIYALKVQYGTITTQSIVSEFSSETLYIQLGLSIDPGDTEITELPIDLSLVSFIIFIIVLVSFAFIAFTVYRSKINIK